MTYKDLKIVYEDNHLLVVVKPYDVPVQADESGDPDMLSMLKQYLVETYNKPGEAYLGLVHRLDRPTGGVMVLTSVSSGRRFRPPFGALRRREQGDVRFWSRRSGSPGYRCLPES